MPTTHPAAIFIFSFWVSFGAVVSPGPVSAAIVSEAPKHRWRAGPLIAAGHAALELLMVLLISAGLSTVMASQGTRTAIEVIGGFVLLMLGAGYIHKAGSGTIISPRAESNSANRSPLSLILLGGITTGCNPFWYTWWVTVAAGYLAQAQALHPTAVGIFYLGHISADFIWDTALAASISAGRSWFTDKRYRVLMAFTGAFMLYLGVVYLHSALSA